MRIGTRGSALALWQAHTVARLIRDSGGPACEIVVIRTSGDERPGPPDPPRTPAEGIDGPPPNIKRMFVKEIQDALVDGRVDLAVHSAKDLPGELPPDSFIAAALVREDPRDALLLPAPAAPGKFAAVQRRLPADARIGTSSVRRIAQLGAVFRDATFAVLRGNVDTRLRKLDAGECEAIVLAAAGVKRLQLDARLTALIPVDVCLPAPGQGIVAVEMTRTAAPAMVEAVRRISDADAEAALTAERAVVVALGGNCQMPLGVLAELDGPDLLLRGVVAARDGTRIIRGGVEGRRGGEGAAGDKLAAQLIAKGASDLLK